MKEKKTVLVLMSGGIDSTACVHMFARKSFLVRGVHVDYRHAAMKAESIACERVARYYGVKVTKISVDLGRRFSAGEIVGRNALLIFGALSAGIVSGGLMSIGIHAGTPYYDCSEPFYRKTRRLVQDYTGGAIDLMAPFVAWNKREIVEYCKREEVPLQLTYSCERGGARPCGKCLSCRDRKSLSV